MNILPIPTGAYLENCYLVWGDAKQALIFDPGSDADHMMHAIKEHDLVVAAYVCTHAHYDHINALADLHDHHPAPILMHSNDQAWAFDARNQAEPYYPLPRKPAKEMIPLESQEEWTFADLAFQRIDTPGHTPGGCSLYFPEGKTLLAGDTLFKGSCGRTDLPGGDPRQLKDSLKKLQQLPDETRVFPGHGEETTIGHEKATNFFMQ